QQVAEEGARPEERFCPNAVAAVEGHPAGLPTASDELLVELFGQGEGQNGILAAVTLKHGQRRASFEPCEPVGSGDDRPAEQQQAREPPVAVEREVTAEHGPL